MEQTARETFYPSVAASVSAPSINYDKNAPLLHLTHLSPVQCQWHGRFGVISPRRKVVSAGSVREAPKRKHTCLVRRVWVDLLTRTWESASTLTTSPCRLEKYRKSLVIACCCCLFDCVVCGLFLALFLDNCLTGIIVAA